MRIFPLHRHQLHATAFAVSPLVQLSDNFLDRNCHGFEASSSVAENRIATLHDFVSIPVGALTATRWLSPPDRNDLIGLCQD